MIQEKKTRPISICKPNKETAVSPEAWDLQASGMRVRMEETENGQTFSQKHLLGTLL